MALPVTHSHSHSVAGVAAAACEHGHSTWHPPLSSNLPARSSLLQFHFSIMLLPLLQCVTAPPSLRPRIPIPLPTPRCASPLKQPFTPHQLNRLPTNFTSSFSIPRRSPMPITVVRAQKQAEANMTQVSNDSLEDDVLQGWPKVFASMFALGCLLGPPLDGIHSRVQLQVYDRGALDIAGLHTNIWVFPMLGLFYSVVGVLQLVLDKYLARKGNLPTADLRKVVLSFITLVTLLEVSSELYKAGVPSNIEAYTLFFLVEANWLVFENTWWGFGLATLVGTACPFIEIPINKLFGLWHYPRGNIEIFGEITMTWVVACYFFYTPFISNLARYLSSVFRTTRSPQKRLD